MAARKRTRPEQDIVPIHPDAGAIDIGSRMHVAAVPPDRDPEPVRSFGTCTGDLRRLADWFEQCGVRTIAMESTSVYWIPAYEILEQRGFEVLLVNARDAKHVPGRKTDVSDAQWLRRLHEYGLLRPSFRPKGELAALRAYLRQRQRLLDYAASHIQHMQKALMQMNVQLHHAVTDITGVTGMRIIRAIVAGERDPTSLARYRDPRCRSSMEEINAALSGNWRDEHVFALGQALELYDVYQAKIAACDVRIEAVLTKLKAKAPATRGLLPARHRSKVPNAPSFDARAALHAVLGVDLTQIHGIGPSLALRLVGECGTDLSAWPSAKHFTSWLCLAPSNKISGGKVLSSKTRRTGSRAAALLRLAAVTVGHTQTALGAFYRRLSARVGKAKAVTATARKIAVLFYNTLHNGMIYADPGASYYEERYQARMLKNLQRRAKRLGYVLQKAPAVA
ncbi:MAG: IS110 family transposase [Acetobacteraceae bacterium]